MEKAVIIWLWSMFIGWLGAQFMKYLGIEVFSLLFWMFVFLITFLNTNFVYYFLAGKTNKTDK